jgi:hypothetical protein
MSRPTPLVIVLVGALGLTLAVGAWLLWPRTPAVPAEEPPIVAVTPTPEPAPQPSDGASAPAAASMPASAPASAPDAPTDEAPLPDSDEAVTQALTELVGRTVVLSLLQTDAFAARVVATVDNLPRPHVAPRLWPLNPTAGRFSVDADGRIAAANAGRYNAAVQLLDTVSPAEAAALLRRMTPALQSAYEQLGYPGKSFRTRLVEVVDHLLATPTITRPPVVVLTNVQGPIKSERPWVRYEYEDPRLQALSSGQRLLLRIGPAHQKRVLAWLRELRDLL